MARERIKEAPKLKDRELLILGLLKTAVDDPYIGYPLSIRELGRLEWAIKSGCEDLDYENEEAPTISTSQISTALDRLHETGQINRRPKDSRAITLFPPAEEL